MSGEGNCLQSVMVCNSTNDWLITQFINTTLDSGVRPSEVQVDIRCTGGCPSSGLELWYNPTNTVTSTPSDPQATFTTIGAVTDGTNTVTGLGNVAGFHLALRALTVCTTIEQISIISSVCSGTTVNLITFPESYAINSPITGQCIENSEQSGSGALTATCGSSDGTWTSTASCVCSSGYFLDNGVCSGNYNITRYAVL